MKLSTKVWHKFYQLLKANIFVFACLFLIIFLAILVRVQQPIAHPDIGEIDVYYWALRTQEFELNGFHGIGTILWLTPVVMRTLHWIIGGDLYNLFLWTGSIISGVFPVVAIYLLSKELTNSKISGLIGALVYGINPTVFYRSVFTVSETFAYIFIPCVLYLSVRLIRKKSLGAYLLMVVMFFLAINTHDSSKLLFLPVLFGSVVFFWSTRKKISTKLVLVITVIAGIVLLIHNPSILAGIKFFLSPSNNGNAAFGDYNSLNISEYVNIFPILFTVFSGFGLLVGIWFQKKVWMPVVLVLLFGLPIIFYQQILPRFFDSTIVPTRLTPYLVFIVAPFFALSVYGWIRLTHKMRRLQIAGLAMGIIIILSHISFANFPLSYITSKAEQASLKKIPLSHQDYVIAQTGMIGMTSVATKTNESNYYGDSTDKIFGATSAEDLKNRIKEFKSETKSSPTGILISKWKLANRDPNYGWWDSLVNPSINIKVFRSTDLPVRFEDNNILLFDVPNTL